MEPQLSRVYFKSENNRLLHLSTKDNLKWKSLFIRYKVKDTCSPFPINKCYSILIGKGKLVSLTGSGRSLGEGNGSPLLYACLRIPWTEEFGGLQPMGSQSRRRLHNTHTHRHTPHFNTLYILGSTFICSSSWYLAVFVLSTWHSCQAL